MRLRAVWLVLTTKNFILFALKVVNKESFGTYVCRTDFDDEMDVWLIKSQLKRMRKTVSKTTK